jgi:hypothetical protein
MQAAGDKAWGRASDEMGLSSLIDVGDPATLSGAKAVSCPRRGVAARMLNPASKTEDKAGVVLA